MMFSPTIQLLEIATEASNVNLSKVGVNPSTDSNTAINFATSGRFNEILSSWTLNPKNLLNVNPSAIFFVPSPMAIVPEVECLDLLTSNFSLRL